MIIKHTHEKLINFTFMSSQEVIWYYMWENTVKNDEKAESENGIFIVIEKRLTALMIAPIVT